MGAGGGGERSKVGLSSRWFSAPIFSQLGLDGGGGGARSSGVSGILYTYTYTYTYILYVKLYIILVNSDSMGRRRSQLFRSIWYIIYIYIYVILVNSDSMEAEEPGLQEYLVTSVLGLVLVV